MARRRVGLTGDVVISVEMTERARNMSPRMAVVFDGYGLPSKGGWIALVSGDMSKCVIVNGATGDVSIAPQSWVIPADAHVRKN